MEQVNLSNNTELVTVTRERFNQLEECEIKSRAGEIRILTIENHYWSGDYYNKSKVEYKTIDSFNELAENVIRRNKEIEQRIGSQFQKLHSETTDFKRDKQQFLDSIPNWVKLFWKPKIKVQ